MHYLVKALLEAFMIACGKKIGEVAAHNWLSKYDQCSKDKQILALQKDFGFDEKGAEKIIAILSQKKVSMKGTDINASIISVKTTDGKFEMKDGSNLCTPGVSISVGKKKDDDDDSYFNIEGGATGEMNNKGEVKLKA